MLDEHVGRCHDPTVRRRHDGGVVARAEQHPVGLRQARGDPGDEPELSDVGNRDA